MHDEGGGVGGKGVGGGGWGGGTKWAIMRRVTGTRAG
jgi:hypothetical protein